MAWRRVLLLVVAAFVVNGPILHSLSVAHRVDTDGRQVIATVTAGSHPDAGYYVGFRYPRDVDPSQQVWTAQVDRATYDASRTSRTIRVRVVPGSPSSYRVDGQVVSRTSLVVTLVGDGLLVVLALLLWRYGGRWRRPRLEARATAPLEVGSEGPLLDKQADGTYLIAGEVSRIGLDHVVLDLGDREVVVHLSGYPGPVETGQSARVTAVLVG